MIYDPEVDISIHAPARGATLTNSLNNDYKINFNPRSRKGSDYYIRLPAWFFSDFNPRSRKGSDGGNNMFSFKVADFNPRSRKGSDLLEAVQHP